MSRTYSKLANLDIIDTQVFFPHGSTLCEDRQVFTNEGDDGENDKRDDE